MRRRRRAIIAVLLVFIAGGAWVAISKSGLVQPSHWQQPTHPVPIISTRGQFKDGKLTAGHDAFDYSIEGELPGLTRGTKPPQDLLIVVHGFNNTAEKARYKFDIARESLKGAGFKGVIAGYSWDADTQSDPLAMTGYHEALHNATANGLALARFIVDYKAACPQTRVHLIGYSMGARVALEALHAMSEDMHLPRDVVPLSSVHLVGASLQNSDVELGQRYGEAIQARCARLFNYYSPEDNKLGYYYPLKEGNRALGLTGILHKDRSPPNYFEIDARMELPKFDASGNVDIDEYGDNHSGYLGTRDKEGQLLDDGVMDLVARNILAIR
jgi:esterase/lipase superfamily enzyme